MKVVLWMTFRISCCCQMRQRQCDCLPSESLQSRFHLYLFQRIRPYLLTMSAMLPYLRYPLCWGRPNITGDTGYQPFGTRSGAFYSATPSTDKMAHPESEYSVNAKLRFDASKSSSKYGYSTTVQPASCQVLIMIKT